jgi:hypothetical protein
VDARIGVTVSMFFLIQPVCRFFMKIERVWRCGISKVEKGKMDQPVGEGTVASYTRAFGDLCGEHTQAHGADTS